MEWNSNPLDLSEALSDAAPQQLWASEEAAFPQAIFFEGAGAPDPAMMDALLLIGSEQAAMPGAANVAMTDAAGTATADALAQVQTVGDFMDALLLISGQNIGMPTDAGLFEGNLAQQTLVDALAGNVVDNLIDHFVETADTSIATKVANAEQLLGMLSHDLAGSGLASAPVLDTASIDEAAQLATIHG
jgi:hypothetical protein